MIDVGADRRDRRAIARPGPMEGDTPAQFDI